MAQTAKTVDIQVLDLLQARLEAIDGTTTNYYRTVRKVGIIDDLPEERWIDESKIERDWDYIITIADVTEATVVENSCKDRGEWTLAISGFFRRKRESENPWQRIYDSDTQVRREMRSDIAVAIRTDDDQLGMLARTPFPVSVDPVVFAIAQLEDHWVGVRTIWLIDYKFNRRQPWSA